MPKFNKRLFSIILSLLIVLSLIISVTAILNRRKPDSMSGDFSQTIINRVEFLIKNTNFVFLKTEKMQDFEFEFAINAKKTEADFYAIIHSISLDEFSFDTSHISPAEGSDTIALPDAALPVKGGKPSEAKWNAQISFSSNKAISADAVLNIVYTSGVKAEAANKHLLEVPIKISVIDQFKLSELLNEANEFVKTAEGLSLTDLKTAITEGNRQITLGIKAKQANIDAAYDEISKELKNLRA